MPGVDTVGAPRIHLTGTFEHQMSEVFVLGREGSRHGKIGELGRKQIEVECQGRPQCGGAFDRSSIPSETPGHRRRGGADPQVAGGPEAVGFIEIPTPTDRSKDLRQIRITRLGVVDVVRGHGWKLEPAGNLGQHIVAGIVFRHTVVPELDIESSGKHLPQPGGSRHRPRKITGLGGPGHRPLMTTGERNEGSSLGRFSQIVFVVDRTVLGPAVLALRHEPADGCIPHRIRSEQHEVVGGWEMDRLLTVHAANPSPARPWHRTAWRSRRGRLVVSRQPDLGAVHDRKTDVASRLMHLDGSPEPVVIGHRQRLVPELRCPSYEILRM